MVKTSQTNIKGLHVNKYYLTKQISMMKIDETQTKDKTRLVLQVSDKPWIGENIAFRRHEKDVNIS